MISFKLTRSKGVDERKEKKVIFFTIGITAEGEEEGFRFLPSTCMLIDVKGEV